MKIKKLFSTFRQSTIWLFALAIIVGLLMSLPFWHYWLGWTVFLILLPFFYLLKQLDVKKLSNRSKIGYIWVSGWVMLLGVTFWIMQTEPGRWTGLIGWLSITLLILTYMLFSLILSLGFVLFGIGWVKLKIRFEQKRVFLILPALWVVCEWLRGWIFSIISIGPDSLMGPHWNFGNLGFAASVTPLVFIGRFVGLLGISFTVVAINLCIYWLIQKRWKLPVIILASIFLLTLTSWYVYKTPTGPSINALALQFGVNQNREIGSIDYHNYLATIQPKEKLDIIVLPEYSSIFENDQKQADTLALSKLVRNSDTPIITSRQTTKNGKSFNTVTVYKNDSSIIYEHDKNFLIPVGEAMPYAFSIPLALSKKDDVVKIREVSKGSTDAQVYRTNGIVVGSQACSGAITPELYRNLVKSGAVVVTNSASLSIFETSQSYHNQAQQMARFMAVANARPFVQATDGSYSFVLSSNGVWQKKSQQKDIQDISDTIQLNSTRTLYTLLGEWVFWMSIIIVIIQGLFIYKKS